MTRPDDCIFYFPARRRGRKRRFLEELGRTFGAMTTDPDVLAATDLVPIVGCYVEIAELVREWDRRGRAYLYRDNGFFRRPVGRYNRRDGYYRWHWGRAQLRDVRPVPNDRLAALKVHCAPWSKGGREIVVAVPSDAYLRFHGCEEWLEDTRDRLTRVTDRPVRVREKSSPVPLVDDIRNAHAVVTHASIAAVEAVVAGVPVFVDPMSAASHVGRTDLSMIEEPVRSDRSAWLNALAYSQFSEREMLDGSMWKMLPEMRP